ncbi:MAG: hypothetical protein ACTHMX_11695 [Thermomicrobiales bacterium]
MPDKAREDRKPVVPAAEPSPQQPPPPPATSSSSRRRSHRRRDGEATPEAAAYLEVIDPSAEAPDGEAAGAREQGDEDGERTRVSASSTTGRTIRSTPAVYRWVCPCQNPPVLLATYGPNARINIKVRDRYWHLHGFGMVEAICPRCAAEHVLDLRHLHRALEAGEEPAPIRIHRAS